MSLLNHFKQITCFAFDVDGVLTDGMVMLTDEGQMMRSMNIKDGYALQLAIKNGYQVVIISGAGTEGVKNRLNKLGITDIYFGVQDKKQVLIEYMQQKKLEPAHVLFMGDDMPDYEVMQMVGISCCPADAVHDIKAISRHVSTLAGGRGCVREVIEKVMKLNGHWHTDTTVASK